MSNDHSHKLRRFAWNLDPDEFDKENGALASFVNLVMMLQGQQGPDDNSDWSSYLGCLSLIPGGAFAKPTHPFHLPLGFPPDGPPRLLPTETAESLERRFATLRELRRQIEDSIKAFGQPAPALIKEIGPKAMATIRGLGADLEAFRFPSGEAYVLGLKMRQAIPSNDVGDAKLIQILDDLKELRDCPKSTRLSVRANRLIYRLPDDRAESAFSSDRRQTWRSIGQRIEQVFTELFPGDWAIVDLRDCEAATVFRGQLIGPTYGDIKRKKEETKPGGAQS